MRDRQIILAFKALFITLFLGLFYIQIIRGEYFYNLSKRNIIRVVALEAARGKILDRNGIVIAESVPSFNVSLIPQEIRNKDYLFNKIAKLLDVPLEDLVKNYKSNYINSFFPVKLCDKLNKAEIIALEEDKNRLKGIVIGIQPKRFYPFHNTASHVIGYLNQIDMTRVTRLKPYGYEFSDLMGYSGIEEYYDLVLRGEKGGEQVEVDNRGERVRTVGFKPPRPGRDIQLTIDIKVQSIIEEVMKDNVGVVVIMDPYTGEIIALSSNPNFDPNDFVESKTEAINDLLIDENSPLFNRAIAGQYAPGSVFKIATVTAALEKDYSLINMSYTCNGKIQIGNRDYNCWSVHNEENLREAIAHSCNVFFYKIGLLAGPEAIYKYAHRLGLGRKTKLDLNYEKKGFVPSPNWKKIIRFQNWYNGDTANMAIGQGDILVTPIQIARMVAVFANGGYLVRPHLIKSAGGRKVKSEHNRSAKLSENVLRSIGSYLLGVVSEVDGTAHVAEIQGLKIAGKTGTAQVQGSQSHGWFVGYVGRDKPKYAFCVFLEHGGSGFFASVVAKKIFSEMFNKDLI
jgi:penicillin-binding protein 2